MSKETRQPARLRDGFQPLPAGVDLFPRHQPTEGCWIYQADSLKLMEALVAQYPDGCFDTIFADPPYFLSNGGTSCRGGQRVKVDKGGWDKSLGVDRNHEFNLSWLRLCRQLLKPDGTIWVSGTHHVIFSIGHAMQQLGYRILNDITWEKPNPAPNLGCRCFTHSTETILWAAKNVKSRHHFDYQLMRQIAGGRQMKTVWKFPAPGRMEKTLGRHPTQKPLALIDRCLLASTDEGGLVLDPFLGSGTTAVACARLGRNCVGIEQSAGYVRLAIKRIVAGPIVYPSGDCLSIITTTGQRGKNNG